MRVCAHARVPETGKPAVPARTCLFLGHFPGCFQAIFRAVCDVFFWAVEDLHTFWRSSWGTFTFSECKVSTHTIVGFFFSPFNSDFSASDLNRIDRRKLCSFLIHLFEFFYCTILVPDEIAQTSEAFWSHLFLKVFLSEQSSMFFHVRIWSLTHMYVCCVFANK